MNQDSQELADILDVMLAFHNGAEVEVRWLSLLCDEADWDASEWRATKEPQFDWDRREYRVLTATK